MDSNFKHGTDSGYNYHKCRCEECKTWKQERDRKYYERNRDRVIEANMAYYYANHEEQKQRRKEYYAEHRDEQREYHKRYAKENAEKVNQKQRKWRRENRWAHWFSNWKYREAKRGQVYDEATLEWIKGLDGEPCTYCGELAETVDHIVPRSNGGTNDRQNLAPACNRCNRRKNNLPVNEFLRRMREEY
jgi:5-methylcytosine-specific restriction endonuclease McrA